MSLPSAFHLMVPHWHQAVRIVPLIFEMSRRDNIRHNYVATAILSTPSASLLRFHIGIRRDDSTIRLWDVKTGNLKANLVDEDSSGRSVCFSPDGST